MRNGENARPTAEISGVKRADNGRALIHLFSCMALASQNAFKAALAECDHAIELDPREPDAFALRGSILRSLGETDRALADLSLAIELRPDDPAGFALRGRALSEAGRAREALADFDRAIALDARDPDAFAARGSVFGQLRHYRSAERDFGRAIALAPGEAAFWNARCWMRMVEGTELSAALSDCREALKRSPDGPHALDSLGWVYFRMNDALSALKAFDRAIQKSPRAASSWLGRGLSHSALGEPARGAAEIAKAESLEPGIVKRFRSYGIRIPVAGRRHSGEGAT